MKQFLLIPSYCCVFQLQDLLLHLLRVGAVRHLDWLRSRGAKLVDLSSPDASLNRYQIIYNEVGQTPTTIDNISNLCGLIPSRESRLQQDPGRIIE
jgi:hypothetical protein